MDISETLAKLRDEDQRKFLTIRTNMRKTYLMAIAATVGIANYATEDDTFMDALDMKCEMLATRSGMTTINNENMHADENASDPFALITRPAPKTANDQNTDSNLTKINEWAKTGSVSVGVQ